MVRTGGTTSTGKGTRQSIVMGSRTRAGTGVGTGAKIRSRIDKRVEGRERLRIYELVIRVGRKTREGGRRQRVASNHSRKARRPFENRRIMLRIRAQLREARNKIGESGGEEISTRKPKRVIEAMWETGEPWVER